MKRTALSLLIAGVLLAHAASAATFVYRGELRDRGAPANGVYDVRVTVHADGGSAAPVTFAGVAVSGGALKVQGETGTALPASGDAWLEVAVREAGSDDAFEPIAHHEKLVLAPAVAACWSMTGDAGTDPSVNFLGTTDAQPLVLRAQNVAVSRFEPSSVLSGGVPVTANVIAGTRNNTALPGARGATVAGGGTLVSGSDPGISGGGPNIVSDSYGTIGGGSGNRAGDSMGTQLDQPFATVAGGHENIATAGFAAIGGGDGNNAGGAIVTIAGGRYNTAYGVGDAIGGGYGHWALGNYGTIAGGLYNDTPGDFATVLGGSYNCAGGVSSAAGGLRAKTRPGNAFPDPCGGGLGTSGDANGDEGSFVWADAQDADLVSTGPNQFMVRATGGVMLNSPTLGFAADDLVVGARQIGGDADSDVTWRTRSGLRSRIYVSDSNGTMHIEMVDIVPGSTYVAFGNGATISFGGTFTNASSRELKEAFATVDPRAVLDQVLALPIQTWSYKRSEEGRHIGPFAEDFARIFGFGADDAHIATIDAEGVALAAIQGLNRKLEAENAELRRRIEALEARAAGR